MDAKQTWLREFVFPIWLINELSEKHEDLCFMRKTAPNLESVSGSEEREALYCIANVSKVNLKYKM